MGMMITVNELLFIGIKGTVLALHRATGQEVWRAKLKGGQFTNLVHERNELFAATQGELFCLEAATGRLRWHNPLKGMGFGIIAFANAGHVPAAAQQMSDDAASSSAAANPAMTPGT